MKQILVSILLSIFILQGNTAQADAPKVGEIAPPLKLTELLQASGKLEKNIQSLQGKVVVLEFWATWCAPCIASMPHLNALSEKFKGKGVQFISITDETTEKAGQFLKKRSIDGWVGIDGDKAMHEAYGVQAIPFTVVIGPDGKVLGYPSGRDLSEGMLADALAGKELTLPTRPVATPQPVSDLRADPLYELSIRPSANENMSNSLGPTSFKTNGITALELVKVAFDTKMKPTQVTAPLPEGKFEVIATNPGKGSPNWAWRLQLQQMLKEVWQIDVRQEKKEMEVYELVAAPSAEKRLVKAKAGEAYGQQSSDDGILTGRNTPIPVLAKALQASIPIPIVNATNLKGKYDYDLYFDEGKPETLIAALEREMGLRLRKVKRPVELVVVEPRQ